ncbi:hypothetical protein BC939DRAFT_84993 [Gamsiella multidivaricata]|uniref:uncharacterized protein n=1 Tax=Gamsiella multidivaricata TaxID=101098 RepID=UPI00221F8EF5|nr:uncharacterized protein BC939DRAFT_84993 [Gamsiella multidivaricata]KAI7827599.1 hypothetical protein BC939DRAFT_84993 [Gamsiella multidivaricata]
MTDIIQTRQRSRSSAIVSDRNANSSGTRQNLTSPLPTSNSSSSSFSSIHHTMNNGLYPRTTPSDLYSATGATTSTFTSTSTSTPYSSSLQPQQSRTSMSLLRPGSGTGTTGAGTRLRSGSNPPPPPLRRDLSTAQTNATTVSDNLFSQRHAQRESSGHSSTTSNGTDNTSNSAQNPTDSHSRSYLFETGDRHRASPGPSAGALWNGDGAFTSGIAVGAGTRARVATSSGSSGKEPRNVVAGAISSLTEKSSGASPSHGANLQSTAKSSSSSSASPGLTRKHSHSISVPPVYLGRLSKSPTPTMSASSNIVSSTPPQPRYSTKPSMPVSSSPSAISSTSTSTSAPNSSSSTGVTGSTGTSSTQGSSVLQAASAVDLAGKRLREQQLQDRIKAAQSFIERTVGQPLPSSDLHESLKDGVILCRLANRLRPGTVEQISLKNLPFVKVRQRVGQRQQPQTDRGDVDHRQCRWR